MGNGIGDKVETLTYEVSFDDAKGFNEEYYSVTYCPDEKGTYITTLSESAGLYTYTTQLTIGVEFSKTGEESVKAVDTVTTTAVFKLAANSLQPVWSEKTVVCHTPKNVDAEQLSQAYTAFDYTVRTEYNEDCTQGTVTYTDRGKTLINAETYPASTSKNFEINQEKYTYLDNEQLLFAIRGLTNSVLGNAHIVNVFNASTSAVQRVKITPNGEESTKFNFSVNGTPIAGDTDGKAVAYTPVSLSLNENDNGATQTVWYARTTDDANNTYRNVILQMQTAISYNIGSLTYKLTNAVFA